MVKWLWSKNPHRCAMSASDRSHDHKFQEEAVQQVAALLAGGVDVEQDVVAESDRLCSVAAHDGSQDRRLEVEVELADAIVRSLRRQLDGGVVVA